MRQNDEPGEDVNGSGGHDEEVERTHVVGIERLEKCRWLSVDGRRLFTFCSEACARDAGRIEATRKLTGLGGQRAYA